MRELGMGMSAAAGQKRSVIAVIGAEQGPNFDSSGCSSFQAFKKQFCRKWKEPLHRGQSIKDVGKDFGILDPLPISTFKADLTHKTSAFRQTSGPHGRPI